MKDEHTQEEWEREFERRFSPNDRDTYSNPRIAQLFIPPMKEFTETIKDFIRETLAAREKQVREEMQEEYLQGSAVLLVGGKQYLRTDLITMENKEDAEVTIQALKEAIDLGQRLGKAEMLERVKEWALEEASGDEWGKENKHIFLNELLKALQKLSEETNK